jgi:hypothetical protein
MAPYLEKGDTKAIAEAKANWRRMYKASWRKNKRSKSKEITTTWEKIEYRDLKQEAKRHNESVTGFVKRATIAYMDKRYVVPNQQEVTKLSQLLALTYNRIGELEEEAMIGKAIQKKLEQELSQLEHEIRVLLFSPKTIEQVIWEQVERNPALKPKLLTYIQTLPV